MTELVVKVLHLFLTSFTCNSVSNSVYFLHYSHILLTDFSEYLLADIHCDYIKAVMQNKTNGPHNMFL